MKNKRTNSSYSKGNIKHSQQGSDCFAVDVVGDDHIKTAKNDIINGWFIYPNKSRYREVPKVKKQNNKNGQKKIAKHRKKLLQKV